jgi:hypothetical protein
MRALTLKPARNQRENDESKQEAFDVIADGVVVGRIFKTTASSARTAWMWTMLFDYRWPTHAYEASREAAMDAFARSWNRSS